MKYMVSNKADPKEYRKRQTRESRKNNPVQYLLNQAKYRARLKGINFSVSIADLVIPTHCPIFGIELYFTPGKRTNNSYSLDRLNNSVGYTPENTRVISWKANQYKGNMTVEEVEALLAYMKGIQH